MLRETRSCGYLVQYDTLSKEDSPIAKLEICAGFEYHVGRHHECEMEVLDNAVSNRHLRVYAIDYETDNIADIKPLVFVEVLSVNKTLLQRFTDVTDPAIPTSLQHLRRGDGAILLNHGDRLAVSPTDYFKFEAEKAEKVPIRTFRSWSRQTEDAKQFEHLYSISRRLIGVGGTSKVYLAYNKGTVEQSACKTTSLNYSLPGKDPLAASSAPIERLRYHVPDVEFLEDLIHPNIAAIERIFFNDTTAYIFQELIPAGDLLSYVINSPKGFLDDAETAVIIRQVLHATLFLHNKNIVHRDLKPDNIMMTSLRRGARIVLTDFGLAKRVEEVSVADIAYSPKKLGRLYSSVGTADYRAPEINEAGFMGYSGKGVDMWSIGIITAVLLSGHLFGIDRSHSEKEPGTQIMENAKRIDLKRLQSHDDWRRIFKRPRDFITRLVTSETTRMTADQALRHHWFTNRHHKDDYEYLYQNEVLANWKPRSVSSSIVVELQPRENPSQRQTTGWLPYREAEGECGTARAGQQEFDVPDNEETQTQLSPLAADRQAKRPRLDEVSGNRTIETVSKFFKPQLRSV